jgi:tripartite-type tricarboxylate transporter receptor subunit TctC
MVSATRSAALVAALVLVGIALPATAQQKYPDKPVRLIVPFPPGGGTDIVGRALAVVVSELFGQQVVVDNRGGAGGSIGAELGVRAAPDGYTMTFVSGSYAVNPSLYKLAYDPVNDIQPISLIGTGAFIVAVHPSVPAKSIRELVALAKAKPGALNYGSTGTGGITQLATELFRMKSGTNITHIPYKGTAPAIADLLGGQIHLMFGSSPSMIPQVKIGRIRALGVTSTKRLAPVPDLPPVSDTVPGYEALLWYGVLGPKGLPTGVVERWSKAIAQAVQSKELVARLAGDGIEPVGGAPDAFAKQLRSEIVKWGEVVKAANIKF